MKVDGQCQCGAIAYVAEVDPDMAWICHCEDCQRLSGAPFRGSVLTEAGGFHLTRGRPRVYVKTAESGAKRAQGFCADCGTPIYAAAAENPTVFNLRLGAINQRSQIAPRRQVWRESALDWAFDIVELPSSPRG